MHFLGEIEDIKTSEKLINLNINVLGITSIEKLLPLYLNKHLYEEQIEIFTCEKRIFSMTKVQNFSEKSKNF